MREIGNGAIGSVTRGLLGLRRNAFPPAAFEFLIANLELEFVLSRKNSTQYKFLIANIRSFLIPVLIASRAF
jgi:hypothetical protein